MQRKLLVIVFIISFIGGLFLGFYAPEKSYTYENVTVKPGDTLWDLTVSRAGNTYNIQELMHCTYKENKLSSSNLVPGQKIRLCIGVEK